MFTANVIWDRHVERLQRLYVRLHRRQVSIERRFFTGRLTDQEYLDANARQQRRIMRIVADYKRYCLEHGEVTPPMLGRPI